MVKNNLRSIRQRLCLSQDELGKCIGVTKANVSHYECFRQQVPADVAQQVIAVAKERGVSVSFDDIYKVPDERKSKSDRRKAT